MNNEHNPIAQRINYLQSFWMQQRLLKPKARFIRWLVDEPDVPLVNGFYKLESSPYGKIEETLVVMFTDFESETSFSYALAKDWLAVYKTESEKHPELQWVDYQSLDRDFELLDPENNVLANLFLVELLTKFKAYEGKSAPLYIGVNPRKITDHAALCSWICTLIEQLPENIGFVVTDYKKNNFFESVFTNEEAFFEKQTIRLKNQDIQGAYTKLMTQGNPNDPQVAFRKCMVKMGEAASKNNQDNLIKWGEKGLHITKQTTDLPFWASAHLIYAGYLFGFKDTERITNLLDKGIQIGKKQPEDKALLGVTLQLYSYKAAYYSFINKKEEGLEWFIKQATLARENEESIVAITAYKNAFLLAEQSSMISEVKDTIPIAFKYGYAIEDSLLKITEFAYIAFHYVKLLREEKETPDLKEELKTIDTRMTLLFGDTWETQFASLRKQIKNKELAS
ncbi:hypothetical protein [Aquimarina muelleri]|uniref:Uncharacterized protein n=1 Tax=Aquimarina muelleri TaxID=279356 RepID=A0A918JZ40_9FLAO|nr:hypothetical protein [Aquimarina muelleri]MCX2764512.1 hypothetical protein [Aquimarina muelleri]GGX30860.1 hypothetical protein GCM10007384_34980 [Aquimarina muelleri]